MTRDELKTRTQQAIDAIRVFKDKDYGWSEMEKMLYEILVELDDSDWHTGTPTEECIDEDNEYCYALCFYYDGWWLSDYLFKANHKEGCFENSPNNGKKVCKFKFGDDIAWQMIEPYKETDYE